MQQTEFTDQRRLAIVSGSQVRPKQAAPDAVSAQTAQHQYAGLKLKSAEGAAVTFRLCCAVWKLL